MILPAIIGKFANIASLYWLRLRLRWHLIGAREGELVASVVGR